MKTNMVNWTVGLIALLQVSASYAQDVLSVGYFAEWPLPAYYGQSSGAYDEVIGAPTQWKSFDNSTAMFAALQTGEIQIALSEGLIPLLAIAADRLDFIVVDIAVSYPTNENCVVHPDLDFTPNRPKVLNAKTIALPLGTITHFNLNVALKELGVDLASVKMVNMAPAQAAAALKHGNVDIACGWGPALQDLLIFGTELLDASVRLELGIGNYDIIAIRAGFGSDNPDTVAKFIKVTNMLNAAYTANPERIIPRVAAQMNMTESATRQSMSGFLFDPISIKLGDEWMAGGVQTHLKELADFLASQNVMGGALENYDQMVDKSYLERAKNFPLISE